MPKLDKHWAANRALLRRDTVNWTDSNLATPVVVVAGCESNERRDNHPDLTDSEGLDTQMELAFNVFDGRDPMISASREETAEFGSGESRGLAWLVRPGSNELPSGGECGAGINLCSMVASKCIDAIMASKAAVPNCIQAQQWSFPSFVIQIVISQNYQNGQDSHVRQVKVYGLKDQ